MTLPKLLLPILLTLSLSACGLFRGNKDEAPPADVSAADSDMSMGGDDLGLGDDDFAFSGGDDDTFAATDGGSFEDADDMFGDSDFFSDDGGFPETPLADTSSDTADSDPFSADSFGADSSSDLDPFGADSSGSDAFAADSSGSDLSYDSYAGETESKAYVPVKKMADAAFERGGVKLNRLYVVREGDTLSSISQKIFGRDRTSDLIKWNSYFASREPKVGDKVYYPSQNNPDDNTMMTYYDDQGFPAQTYLASAGENIREISKNLLGHERSWMEIYATNPSVESKGELTEGTAIRYWPQGTSAPVQASSPSGDDPFGAPSAPMDIASSSDPFGSSDSDMGMGGINPPPSFGDDDPFGDSDTAMAPPPPPPPRQVQPGEELSLPPPPPPPPRAAPAKPATAGGDQDNMLLILGGAGLLVFIVIYLIVRRKKSSIDMGHTQV